MTFKEQLIKELKEDTAFRQEIAGLLSEELNEMIEVQTQIVELDKENNYEKVLSEVSFYFQLDSDKKRIESLEAEKRLTINSSFSRIWSTILTKQHNKPTETRKLFVEEINNLIVEKEPLKYICSINSILDSIETKFISELNEHNQLKQDIKLIDYILDFDFKKFKEEL